MQAYFDQELNLSLELDGFYELNFYGSNFKCIYDQNKEFQEFKSNQLFNLSELKQDLLGIMPLGLLITGGEPLLQRQSLLNILSFCKKNNIKTAIKTNATKPVELISLLKADLIDVLIINLISNENNFKKITKCETFFKTTEDVYQDFLKSITLLKDFSKKIKIIFNTQIVPGYLYRKEDFIEFAELIKDIDCVWKIKKYIPSLDNSFFKNINPVSEYFIDNIKNILNENYPQILIEFIY